MSKHEPKFMKRLHKIRESLCEEWRRESEAKILDSLHSSAERFHALSSSKKDKAA